MDILTHTLSGAATGTLVAAFSGASINKRMLIVSLGAFAGALPDIDAISLWSGFDATVGQLFNLPHSGREIYSAKLWYSHHAFMHSLMAAWLFSLLGAIFSYLFKKKFKHFQLIDWFNHTKQNQYYHIAFTLGFLIHLLQDMPTPASSWGGVNLFWPSSSYIGGFGNIWWWNNYDIFLVVLVVLLLNGLLLSTQLIQKTLTKKLIISIFSLGFVMSLIQIKTRPVDFSYSGSTNQYQQYEAQSKEIQKQILGAELYNAMERFDNQLSIYF